jgi:hypothetical protein
VEAGQGLREKEGGEARKAFAEEETSQPFFPLFFLSFFDFVRDDGGWATGGFAIIFSPVSFFLSCHDSSFVL